MLNTARQKWKRHCFQFVFNLALIWFSLFFQSLLPKVNSFFWHHYKLLVQEDHLYFLFLFQLSLILGHCLYCSFLYQLPLLRGDPLHFLLVYNLPLVQAYPLCCCLHCQMSLVQGDPLCCWLVCQYFTFTNSQRFPCNTSNRYTEASHHVNCKLQISTLILLWSSKFNTDWMKWSWCRHESSCSV